MAASALALSVAKSAVALFTSMDLFWSNMDK